ncbi:ABC transporter permease [Paenibacillus pasadenensis]|uniref:ABC-type polysaccharide transport system, permease component n=1 Tax=Paenibacillus pasadenensis TaxID=217090 RepID=A0A2N5ND30_9BACL|nr:MULTISPECIES: ABC transporter permease subunit [Paenibacillus]PLT48249.1 ABC-type polysaccharide transport system, permease component [Paenibacillus pasadenensis]QGG58248.1 ABC transporter permease subunit [Paenibacillus sp. B01]
MGTTNAAAGLQTQAQPQKRRGWRRILRNWELYAFIAPAFFYFLIFAYGPMYGIQIAFKNYVPTLGFAGSPWVGFDHFTRFFNSYYFWDLIWNTLSISLYELAVGFPIPIILALAFNEVKNGWFKKTVQTVTYAPHFISVVVMAGMIITFLSPSTGIITHMLEWIGLDPPDFLTDPRWFKTMYVLSGVWQGAGWGTIIYLAALSGVDPGLHEAAIIDGASRFQRLRHINIPTLVPTMTILLILNIGSLLSVGFEKILLLQNPLNMEASNIIATFVYKAGLVDAQYSFSTAVGLFNSVINCILLVAINQIVRRTSENSLW